MHGRSGLSQLEFGSVSGLRYLTSELPYKALANARTTSISMSVMVDVSQNLKRRKVAAWSYAHTLTSVLVVVHINCGPPLSSSVDLSREDLVSMLNGDVLSEMAYDETENRKGVMILVTVDRWLRTESPYFREERVSHRQDMEDLIELPAGPGLRMW